MSFYETLRQALSTFESGIHFAGLPASANELAQAEKRLGASLPASLKDFFLSFHGVLLFHETVQIFPVVDDRFCTPRNGYFRIGEVPQGTLWMDGGGVILCVDEEQPDPIIMGSSLELFLDSIIARESLLLDKQGEFYDVFDAEGELSYSMQLKQARLGKKRDPKASFYLYEEAQLLLEEKREEAVQLLQKAISLDPKAGPCLELLASLYRDQNQNLEAASLFVQAAQSSMDQGLAAARWIQAAILSGKDKQTAYAAHVWEQYPGYAQELLDQILTLTKEHPEEAKKRSPELQLLLEAAPTPFLERARNLTEQLNQIERQLRTKSLLKVL